MAVPSVTNTFVANTTAAAADVNQNFDDVIDAITDGTADLTVGSVDVTGVVDGSDFIASRGAVATPSHTFTGDLNTGMWSSDADTLDFSTAGANRLSINSAGGITLGAGLLSLSTGTSSATGTIAAVSPGTSVIQYTGSAPGLTIQGIDDTNAPNGSIFHVVNAQAGGALITVEHNNASAAVGDKILLKSAAQTTYAVNIMVSFLKMGSFWYEM